MKKVICLSIAAMMLLMSSCSLSAFSDKSEAVNKDIEEDSRVINPIATPYSPNSSNLPDNNDISTKNDASKKLVNNESLVDNNTAERSEPVNDQLVPAVVLGGIPDDTWLEDGYTPITLYFKDADGYIIPITKKAVNQPTIAKLTLSKLVDDSANREELAQYGLYPTIPQGTEILGVNVANGIATIDFSSSLLDYKTDLDERNMISSIIYTVTQFPNITGVKLTCTGKKLSKMRFGTDASGVLYRANIMINCNKLNVTIDYAKQDIFVFRDSDASTAYCLPVSIEYEGNSVGTDFTKTIELLAGQNKKGLASLLPEGTKLIGSKIDNNTLTLNFSKDIRRYAGNMREEAILRQLQYTFSQYKGINSLRIFIEGNQNAVLPEGTDLSETFIISKALNRIIE